MNGPGGCKRRASSQRDRQDFTEQLDRDTDRGEEDHIEKLRRKRLQEFMARCKRQRPGSSRKAFVSI